MCGFLLLLLLMVARADIADMSGQGQGSDIGVAFEPSSTAMPSCGFLFTHLTAAYLFIVHLLFV